MVSGETGAEQADKPLFLKTKGAGSEAAVRGRHGPESHPGWRPNSRNPTPARWLLSMSGPFTQYAHECQDFFYLIHIFFFKKDFFLFRAAPSRMFEDAGF